MLFAIYAIIFERIANVDEDVDEIEERSAMSTHSGREKWSVY